MCLTPRSIASRATAAENRRVRDDHDAMHGAGHGTNIRVALLPLDLRGVPVDGDDFMTGFAKPAKDGVGRGRTRPRHAGHDDALPGKEVCYGLGEVGQTTGRS
jgi:hypothetical protein